MTAVRSASRSALHQGADSGRGLGNGAVEGGMLTPIQFSLPMNWQLVVDPEVDVLANTANPGRHATPPACSASATRSPRGSRWSLEEIWGDANFDPTGTVQPGVVRPRRRLIPPSLPTFQLDAGVNLGLDPATPGVQVYLGVSQRF